MASSKTRQRALARAKLERQIARRAAAARRRRQLMAAVGAGLAVLVVAAGVVWATGGFDRLFKSEKPSQAASDCTWSSRDVTETVKDVGKPPTTGVSKAGTAVMTITTNQGVIETELDRAKAPCTVASFTHLAGKQFFNDSKCHRLTTQGIFVLQCGDPSGTGTGGPAYRFGNENLPSPADPAPGTEPTANLYPKGTLAMANSGPDTNGSQFFIVYQDGSSLESKYTIFGKVTKGLEIVDKIVAGGINPKSGEGDGEPKTEIKIQSLTVADAPAQPSAPTAPPSTPSS